MMWGEALDAETYCQALDESTGANDTSQGHGEAR